MPGNPHPASGGSGVKQELKGAILQKYDLLFSSVERREGDPGGFGEDETFWSSFFSITPKISLLESRLSKANPSQVAHNLQLLFHKSVDTLGLWYELEEKSRHIKVFHALHTLAGLLRCILKRSLEGEDGLLRVLLGFKDLQYRFSSILSHICNFLSLEESPDILQDVCLNILLIFVAGGSEVGSRDSVSGSNVFLVPGHEEELFKVLVHLLIEDETSEAHSSTAVLLLTILVQHRKYDSDNPYAVQLSLLDEEVALSAISRIINSSLSEFLKSAEEERLASGSESWLNYFVGSMFVGEGKDKGHHEASNLNSSANALLALYEAIHLNRNFIATLTHYSSKGQSDDSPSNLLVSFLEFTSLIMDTFLKRDHSTIIILNLNFIILLCVTEDNYANVLMHDPNLVFRVRLSSSRALPPPEPKPLAHSILDLSVKFVGANVKKVISLSELISQVLSLVHRVLSYEKKSRTRITYPWKDLWKVLMDLLESISKETGNSSAPDLYGLAHQGITIFNLFITFGDTFLPCPSTYDELYYEITRRSEIFSRLYQKACTYSAKGGRFKDSAVRVTNALVNIRAITSHFKHIIEAWLKSEELSTPTPEQTLEVVKSNYESLTLKLQEGLDAYEPYSEAPKHSEFFQDLLRRLNKDAWLNKVSLKELQPRAVLETFSSLKD